jgi:hypothetical protein
LRTPTDGWVTTTGREELARAWILAVAVGVAVTARGALTTALRAADGPPKTSGKVYGKTPSKMAVTGSEALQNLLTVAVAVAVEVTARAALANCPAGATTVAVAVVIAVAVGSEGWATSSTATP